MASVDAVLPWATGRNRTRALLLRARVYLKEPGREKDAERELRSLLDTDSQSAEAFYLLGTLAKNANRPKQAGAFFRKALEINPRHAGARAETPPDETPPQSLLGKLFSR
jgi:Tfp pilus assembly protein PilF